MMWASHQSIKLNDDAILLKTRVWLSFTLTTAGFGFVLCCYPVLLLPSFLTFGLFCNRKLCHFFNWQGLVQHLQPQGSELEFGTSLFTGHSFFCPESSSPLSSQKAAVLLGKSDRACRVLFSLLSRSALSSLVEDTGRVHCIESALWATAGRRGGGH